MAFAAGAARTRRCSPARRQSVGAHSSSPAQGRRIHRQTRLSSPPTRNGPAKRAGHRSNRRSGSPGSLAYRLASSAVVVRPESDSSTRIALAWRVRQHHGVDWRGGADRVEHRPQDAGLYRPGSEGDHRPRRFRHGDRELADVGNGFQRGTARFAGRADRLNLGVGFVL